MQKKVYVEKYREIYDDENLGIEEYNIDVPEEKWYWTFVRMDKVLELRKDISTKELYPNDFDVNNNLILYVQTDSE